MTDPQGPFDEYRAEFDQPDFDNWRELFAAGTVAQVETLAELAGQAAYIAVRNAAVAADQQGGGAIQAAEAAHAEIELVADEITRVADD